MSYFGSTKERNDRYAPQIRPAGVQGDYESAGVADLTSSYNPNNAVTPTNIKAHEHRGTEVGQPSRHWGKANDTPADPNAIYGRKNPTGENIDQTLRPQDHVDRTTARLDELRESKYKSNQMRPLGHGPAPAYPVPTPHEGFGVPTAKSESAKATMDAMHDVDVIRPAEQQLNRNYDWDSKGIDPTQTRFGAQTNKSQSAQEALARSNETELIPRIMKDYDSISKPELGKSKPYGFDNPEEWDPNTTKKKNKSKEPSVGEVLSTWAVHPNSGNDGTLDASASRRAQLNQSRKDQDNAYLNSKYNRGNAMDGTYTTDSTGRTVLTLEEMGDEATAPQLVNPSHYVSLGVQSKYFAGGRDLEGVRALCHKCNFGMTDAQIDEVFAATSKNGLCGIEQFKNAATARGYI